MPIKHIQHVLQELLKHRGSKGIPISELPSLSEKLNIQIKIVNINRQGEVAFGKEGVFTPSTTSRFRKICLLNSSKEHVVETSLDPIITIVEQAKLNLMLPL